VSEADDIAGRNEQILRAYGIVFGSPSGQIVLTDLVAFCRASETCYVAGDTHATAMLEGRREVFLRIQQYSKLTFDEILRLRQGRINLRATGEAA
jgi:hypothetical protein